MEECFGIVAALPGELKPLVASWQQMEANNGVNAWKHPSRSIYAVCAGMGSEAARRAFDHLTTICNPTTVLSIGWAGSIDPRLPVGSVHYPSQIVDSEAEEHYPLHLDSTMLLISADKVADRGEKYRLALAYSNAALVDMEAATIASLAFAKGCKFRCIKAVSDGANEELPDMNPYITKDGKFATAPFVASVMVRPWYWAALTRFGKNARLAAENLAAAVKKDLNL